MWPYFFVFFILLLLSAVDTKCKKNTFKIFAFVVLVFFAGFRYGVGRDYFSYIEIFNAGEGEFSREPGRNLLINIIKVCGGADQLYIFIMALITEFFAYKTLIKYEKRDFWFITIMFYCISLFYIASFNASRQYMAISMMLWGLQYTKKIWLFMIITLFAGFGLHYSALMFVPLYFFITREHSKKLIFAISLGLIIVNKILLDLLALTPYAKYGLFIDNDMRENQVQMTQYLLAVISLLLIVFKDKFKVFKENTVLVNLNVLCFYTLLLVIMQDIPTFIMLYQRINNYFVYSFLLIIPAVLSSFSKKNAQFLKIFLLLFSITYFIVTITIKGEHHMLVPYNMNFHLFNF